MYAVLLTLVALLAGAFLVARGARRFSGEGRVKQEIEALIAKHRGQGSSSGPDAGATKPSPPPLPPRASAHALEPDLRGPRWGGVLRAVLPIAAVVSVLAFATLYLLRSPPAAQPRDGARKIGALADSHPRAEGPALELLEMVHQHRGVDVVIEGLVKNAGNDTLQNITPIAILYDVRGRFMTTAAGRLLFAVLPPHESAPFDITLRDDDRLGRFEMKFRDGRGSPLAILDRRTGSHDYINPPVDSTRAHEPAHQEAPHASAHP